MNQPSIGTSRLRREDATLLRGDSRFLADLAPPPGTRYVNAVFVRSPFASATIDRIDSSDALAEPGVVAVFTAEDLAVKAPPLNSRLANRFAQPVLADGTVRFVGEAVAVVVAETVEAAVDASELVVVDYTPLPVELDPDTDDPERTVDTITAKHRTDGEGDDAGLFTGCDVVVRERITNPRLSPAPIEPRGLTCQWIGDRCIIVATTQRPHGYRDQLARLLDIDPSAIDVAAPQSVGGGFGGKPSRSSEEHALPLVARALAPAPLRWVETRSEYLAAATHGRGEHFDITIGGTKEGRLVAVEVDMVKDNGAYPTSCAFLPEQFTLPNLSGCYRFERAAFRSRSTTTNTAPVSAYRGAGRAAYVAALERMVDRFAAEAGLDPARVRAASLIAADEMPYTTVVGSTYDEADYPADLNAALNQIDYDAWRQRQADHTGGSTLLGIGVGCYNHLTVGGGGEEAVVSIRADGGAVVLTGTTDQGHGHITTWSQIASDALGIPAERIEVREGSTAYTSTGVGAVGSRSLQTAGIAIHTACDALVTLARQLAANELEAAEADIRFDPFGAGGAAFHVVGTPARSLRWADLYQAGDLTCGDYHDPGAKQSYPSGCHAAVVEVSIETGAVAILRYVAVDDSGRRVNPAIVDGQLHGGIAAGIGQVLGEEIIYDERGNLLTGTFGSYAIATADLLPSFELVASETLSSFNREGYKGVGESGTIGAVPAVHNAIVDALAPLGIRHLELPATPERVWRAVEASRSS